MKHSNLYDNYMDRISVSPDLHHKLLSIPSTQKKSTKTNFSYKNFFQPKNFFPKARMVCTASLCLLFLGILVTTFLSSTSSKDNAVGTPPKDSTPNYSNETFGETDGSGTVDSSNDFSNNTSTIDTQIITQCFTQINLPNTTYSLYTDSVPKNTTLLKYTKATQTNFTQTLTSSIYTSVLPQTLLDTFHPSNSYHLETTQNESMEFVQLIPLHAKEGTILIDMHPLTPEDQSQIVPLTPSQTYTLPPSQTLASISASPTSTLKLPIFHTNDFTQSTLQARAFTPTDTSPPTTSYTFGLTDGNVVAIYVINNIPFDLLTTLFPN